ncbi:protein SCO1 homolog 1, mitochondrial isoform X2 [Andrographis paniculata]|uniref:protein SCO1 homolog 1, mitochondrial isoform X2 n=1 Tax=Andrographis paniculata TaxID=175694 RepID=UPI0021E9A226|nr:protein SCO1 homolog 1, mitochondrial isoform X2 [Andrographis paniculata]
MAAPILRNARLRQIYNSLLRLHSSTFPSLPPRCCNSIPTSDPNPLFKLLLLPSSLPITHRAAFCTTPSHHPAANHSSNSTVSHAAHGDKNYGAGGAGAGSQESSQQGKPVRGGPVSWMSFFLLLCTGAGLVYYYDREKRRRIEGISRSSNVVKQGPAVGKAAIGGPFDLIDHNGKPVSDKDFLGKWTLIYFGFTHCPDICPDELQKLASAIDKIKEKSKLEVVPVFISVDPERDTVEHVREYVREFHPKLIGLTGSPEQVKNAARAYRVYYMKTEDEGSDYLVDHSIVFNGSKNGVCEVLREECGCGGAC